MGFDLDKMYCGVINRGDVFLCLLHGREVPVVVLQDRLLNERLSTVVTAEILIRQEGERVFKNEILLRDYETGLGEDGICALHKIITIDRRLMVAKKGELSSARLQEIYQAMDINCGRFRDKCL